MHDIKWIRENPEAFDAALARRGAEPAAAGLIALDEKRRSVIQSLQDMQSRRNAASKEIGAAMAQKNMELAEKLKAEVADLKDKMPRAEEEDRNLVHSLDMPAGVAPTSWNAYVLRDGDPVMVIGVKSIVQDTSELEHGRSPMRTAVTSDGPRPLLVIPLAAERREV